MLPSISQYTTLFAEFGNLTLVPQFTKVLPLRYWSGTEAHPGTSAWVFDPATGGEFIDVESDQHFAVAVRPGDVAAPVPEPQTLSLVLLALSAAVVGRRRRPA